MAKDWWLARRKLADGRDLFVVPLTFGRARLTVGWGEYTYEDGY